MTNLDEELADLAELHHRGELSDDEYHVEKSNLIGQHR